MSRTVETIKAGQYDWRRLAGYLLAGAGTLAAAAQLADRLPPVLQPVFAVIGPWAELAALVTGTWFVKIGKPVVVREEGE